MRKIFIIPCVACIGALFFCNGIVFAQAPGLQADYEWDFGAVKEGLLKHNFTLRNTTAKTLNIVNVSTSCGCTVSTVNKRTLLPDETTVIEAEFNSKGYNGPISQYVYVHTDNAENPILRFTIKADVS